jgi:hypothetical protein
MKTCKPLINTVFGAGNMHRIAIAGIFVASFFQLEAQNVENIKKTTKELSSPAYFGRGYEHRGDFLAAQYIENEYKTIGLEKLQNQYMQPFSFSINSFPDTLELSVDGKKMIPGKDYVLRKSAFDTAATFKILYFSNSDATSFKRVEALEKMNLSDKILVFDFDFLNENFKTYDTVYKRMFSLPVAGMINLTTHPLRSYAMHSLKVRKRVTFDANKNTFDTTATTLSLKVHTKYLKDYNTNNVVGMIKGKKFPNKYIVIGGHYDHLGVMGQNVIFPGADDNASGIGVMLELARYFKKNQPDYSLIFIAFSAEEAGLLGATHFVNNCPVPTADIKFMLNLDMVGFGATGIDVFNGTNEPELMEKMNEIVKSKKLDIQLISKENINQSDHFPFTEKKIPALFVTTGVKDSPWYHSVDDTYSSVTFEKIEPLMQLLIEMIKG